MCTTLSRFFRLILESMQMDEMFQWASRSSQDVQNFLSLWPSLHWSGFGRDDNYYVSVSLLRNYATRFASWFSICGKTRRTAGEQIVVSLHTQHYIESQWCIWLCASALDEEELYNGISLKEGGIRRGLVSDYIKDGTAAFKFVAAQCQFRLNVKALWGDPKIFGRISFCVNCSLLILSCCAVHLRTMMHCIIALLQYLVQIWARAGGGGGEGEGGGGSVPVVRSQAPALGAFCAGKV